MFRQLLLPLVKGFQLWFQLFNERLVLLIRILHQDRLGKVSFTLFFPLKSGIRNFTYFLRIELRPSFSMIRIVKVSDRFKFDKVDKCIANVAVVFHVNRQIKKIVFALKLHIDFRDKKFFSEFIRNVLYHDSRLFFIVNLIPNNIELFFVENRVRIFLSLFSFL